MGTAAAIWVGQCAVAYAGDHVVSKGDTLSDIAVRYGTTTGALARANGLSDPNLIIAGTRLTIPDGSSSSASAASGATHTVRAGETLWDLAQRFGTSVNALARANGISNPNLIVAGSKITVSGGDGASATASMGGATHTVQAGETLSDIAARFGVSVSSLARANGIQNPNLIVAGTSISVPGAATGTAPAPVSATEVGYLLEQEAVANGVNPSLIKAMAYQESGWQQDVVSSAGAIGVMQVMPGTARWVNEVLLGGASLNVRQAHDNIKMGVSYMRYLLSIMPTQDQALAAYYSGPGNVGSKLHRYQRVYVKAVNAHVSRF
jgi:N-acetylmuramoyl-L-alanine amidase